MTLIIYVPSTRLLFDLTVATAVALSPTPLKGTPMKIKGSIALVTGASSGIGETTAKRLAMAGYKVYGTSRRGAQPGQRSFAMLPLDVTSDESVEAAVRELIRLEGRIDLLVNNGRQS